MNSTTLVDLCTVVALLNQDLSGKEAEGNQLNSRIQELAQQVKQLQAKLNESNKQVEQLQAKLNESTKKQNN